MDAYLVLSYLIATVESTIISVDHFDFWSNKYDLSKNSWPHCTLAKAPPSSLLNCVCAFSSSSPAIIVQSGPVKNPLTSAGHHQMWKLKKKKWNVESIKYVLWSIKQILRQRLDISRESITISRCYIVLSIDTIQISIWQRFIVAI